MAFSKAKVLLVGCLVFILGIALASFAPAELLFSSKIWWFGTAVFFLVLAILFWQTAGADGAETDQVVGTGRDLYLRLLFLFVAVFLFAIWRYGVSLPASTPDKIWHYNLPAGQAGGQTVSLRGYVTKEPDVRDTSQKLEIAVGAIHELPQRKVSGKLLVTTNLYPEYEYGDELEMACELKQPEEFNGFAYDRYLARYDIYSVCYYPKILPPSTHGLAKTSPNPLLSKEGNDSVLSPGGEVNTIPLSPPLSRGRGNWLYAKIFALKKFLTGLIDAGLPEPESSLARPVVFGGQRGLEQSIRDDFQKVGLTHIMAVSGFNISILAALVMAMLLALGLSRGKAFYLAVAFLAVYIILVGAPASAMRAGLMGFLVLWALKLGRLNKMTNSLVLTAAFLLLINPKLLRDDVGFELSFLAMAGLVYVYPIFDALWTRIKLPKLKGVSDALLITLAAQIFTWPVLAYNFSQISLIAPLANLAVLWAVPLLTILILAALPLAALLPEMSFIFFSPSLILTKYILAAVRFFAGWPQAYLEINYLSVGWVIIYYAVAVWLIIKLREKLLKPEISDKI